MDLLESHIACPYCGQALTIFIDPSIPEQQYTEDCQVCCAPMIIDAQLDGEDLYVTAKQENEI